MDNDIKRELFTRIRLIRSPCTLPPGELEQKGWNEVTIKRQHTDNFPDICEKCNLSVTLMMSAGCCVQRGIGLKCLRRGQGKPFQMELRRGKRDTIATKGVRYGSLGLLTGPSLSQLLVSSWSNLINLSGGTQTREEGCVAGANVGQISWTDWGAVDPLLQCHPATYTQNAQWPLFMLLHLFAHKYILQKNFWLVTNIWLIPLITKKWRHRTSGDFIICKVWANTTLPSSPSESQFSNWKCNRR